MLFRQVGSVWLRPRENGKTIISRTRGLSFRENGRGGYCSTKRYANLELELLYSPCVVLRFFRMGVPPVKCGDRGDAHPTEAQFSPAASIVEPLQSRWDKARDAKSAGTLV